MAKYLYLIFILTLFVFSESVAQRYLLLDKPGTGKRWKFYEGQSINFKLKGESHFNEDVIKFLHDSTIILDQGVIFLKEISAIRFPSPNRGAIGRKLRVAGIGLMVIDQFNTVVISGEPARIVPGILIASGSIIALSYIIDLAQKNTVKIKGNRRLRIMESIL